MNNFNKKAFTLSEVLVTLAVIGVVSALTVPTLMNKYQKKAYVVQLHKVYTELSQTIDLIMTDEAKINLSATTANANPGNFLKTYFKIVTDCGGDITPCFAASYRSINGGGVNADCEGYTVALTSGSSICMTAGVPKVVTLDINGSQGPNIAGRDLFAFMIYNDGSIDEPNVTPECKLNNTGCSSPQAVRNTNAAQCLVSGGGCFGRILNDNWVMNY